MNKNLWIKSSEKCPYTEKHIPVIIEALKKLLLLNCDLKSIRTQRIKRLLAIRGNDLGYRVYANKIGERFANQLKLQCSREKYNPNKEWLLDMIWCEEDEKVEHEYQIKNLIMGMECEWGSKRYPDDDEYGNVKYDFQKLLVTESDLCVMIFKWRKKDEELIAAGKENALSEYFQNAVNGYEGYLKNRILCIGYCNKFESFYFRIFKNKKCNE